MESQISLVRKLSNQSDLRRKFIGGISEADVNIFIKNIQEHYEAVEKDYNQRIKELSTSKNEILSDFEHYVQQTNVTINELRTSLEKTQNDSLHYKNKYHEAEKQLAQFTENHSSEIAELYTCIKELKDQNLNYQEKISMLEIREMDFKNEHKARIQDLEDKLSQNIDVEQSSHDIQAIYRQLDNLKEHVTLIDNLKKQLQREQIRADKAEANLYQLTNSFNEMKELVATQQKQLEIEFSQFYDKYKSMQHEVSNFHSPFSNFKDGTNSEIDTLLDRSKI